MVLVTTVNCGATISPKGAKNPENAKSDMRTREQICARLALDMWREAHAEGRQQTLAALHRARAG